MRKVKHRVILIDEFGQEWVNAEMTATQTQRLIKAYAKFGIYLEQVGAKSA